MPNQQVGPNENGFFLNLFYIFCAALAVFYAIELSYADTGDSPYTRMHYVVFWFVLIGSALTVLWIFHKVSFNLFVKAPICVCFGLYSRFLLYYTHTRESSYYGQNDAFYLLMMTASVAVLLWALKYEDIRYLYPIAFIFLVFIILSGVQLFFAHTGYGSYTWQENVIYWTVLIACATVQLWTVKNEKQWYRSTVAFICASFAIFSVIHLVFAHTMGGVYMQTWQEYVFFLPVLIASVCILCTTGILQDCTWICDAFRRDEPEQEEPERERPEPDVSPRSSHQSTPPSSHAALPPPSYHECNPPPAHGTTPPPLYHQVNPPPSYHSTPQMPRQSPPQPSLGPTEAEVSSPEQSPQEGRMAEVGMYRVSSDLLGPVTRSRTLQRRSTVPEATAAHEEEEEEVRRGPRTRSQSQRRQHQTDSSERLLKTLQELKTSRL